MLALRGRVALTTGLAIWKTDCAEMRKLAALVSAAAFVKTQAKCLVAMARQEVGMWLWRRGRSCLVRLNHSLQRLATIAFAFAFVGAQACRL